MVADESSYKAGVFERKGDQDLAQALVFKVNRLKIQVAGVGVLAGQHLVLEGRVKREFANTQIVVCQPGRYADSHAQNEDEHWC